MRPSGQQLYRQRRAPRGRVHWRAAAFCAVDLELTGLDPVHDEIISFAAIPVEHGQILLGDAVEGLVRPRRPPSAESIVVHGLRAADLAVAPGPDEAFDALLATMAGRVPVVHVAGIERPFLRRAFRQLGVRLRRPMIDTSVLGALWLSEREATVPRPPRLANLAQALGLPRHREHIAGTDALSTAEVFVALASHFDAVQRTTVRSLLTAQRRLTAMRTYRVNYADLARMELGRGHEDDGALPLSIQHEQTSSA